MTVTRHKDQLELPYVGKYLLVSTYLASYNPASSDVAIFAKRQPKKRGKKRKRIDDKVQQHLLGPKNFTLDRCIAILHSLLEMNTGSAEVYSQARVPLRVRRAAELCCPRLRHRVAAACFARDAALRCPGEWRRQPRRPEIPVPCHFRGSEAHRLDHRSGTQQVPLRFAAGLSPRCVDGTPTLPSQRTPSAASRSPTPD